MSLLLARHVVVALALSSAMAAAVFGPPHIAVKQVTDAKSAPAGAVLLIEGRHHTELGGLTVTGRAEGLRNGQRVHQPIALNDMGVGQYSVTRQWASGTAWVLVFTGEVGENETHGVAEAMVKVNTQGAIVSIDYPEAGWLPKTNEPRRVSTRDVDAALAQLAAKP